MKLNEPIWLHVLRFFSLIDGDSQRTIIFRPANTDHPAGFD